MKKYLYYLKSVCVGVLSCLAIVSCSDEDDTLKSYDVTITLNLPADVELSSIADLKVVATSDKGVEKVLNFTDSITTETMATTVVELLAGQYEIIVSGSLTATKFITGKKDVDVYEITATSVDVTTQTVSTLIFKSIYNAGGKAGYVKDTYFEIVNNSDEVQYLDRLMLSSPQGNQTKENAWQANEITDRYASGQGTVIAFPGSGTEYPLEPGESVIIANDAVDHKDLSGSENCANLTNADWEIYIEKNSKEIDYSVRNIDVVFSNNSFMAAFGLGFFGRAFILARCPEGVTPAQFAANPDNRMTTPGTTSDMEFLMIHSDNVLDAVDIWDARKTDQVSTFLPQDDAQGVKGSAGWSGKSVMRKVARTVEGRVYYQDTNNSSNDFESDQPLVDLSQPRQ